MAVITTDSAARTTGAANPLLEHPLISTFDADPAVEGEAQRLMKHVHAAFGRLDVLVNGSSGSGVFDGRDGAAVVTAWTACVEAAVPFLAPRRGAVVSIVSSAGRYRAEYFRPENRKASKAHEAMANGAILALSRQLAMELAPKGIRVNAVVAGLTEDSPQLLEMTERERTFLLEEISLRRFGRAEEIASVVAFLASPASRYVTGDAIDVNGGWWMS